MSMSLELPEEGESARIGRMAVKSFRANIPNSWSERSLEGTDDAGFDCQLQVLDKGKYRYLFRAQIKGSESPAINAAGDTFSVVLKARTINYYEQVTEPIMLVFCDLSVNPSEPVKCPLYYVWIHDALRRHREQYPDLSDQATLTIHVPKANAVTSDLDVSGTLEAHLRVYKAGIGLERTVERKRPGASRFERADALGKITVALEKRSSALVDALTATPISPWVDAPKGSIAAVLHDASERLRTGDVKGVSTLLNTLESRLSDATELERAEFWYLKGREHSYNSNDDGASDAFRRAYAEANLPKHLVAWVETDLRNWFIHGTGATPSQLVERLSESESEETFGLLARVQSAAGNHAEADRVLALLPRVKALSNLALVAIIRQDWDQIITVCSEGLSLPDVDDQGKQLFYLLRGRAYFHKALGALDPEDYENIPATGPIGMDIAIVRLAWSDIWATVLSLKASGWPPNSEVVADVWCSAAAMLGMEEETLPLMNDAADARPTYRTLQICLESIAARCGNMELALKANARLLDNPRYVLKRIILLHNMRRHSECVALLDREIDRLPQNDFLFPAAVSMAIASATIIVRADIVQRYEAMLRAQPEWADHVALMDFYRAIRESPLDREIPLGRLYDCYKKYPGSRVLGVELLLALDPTVIEQASTIVEVAEDIRRSQHLTDDSEIRLCQALITLDDWPEVLRVTEAALMRLSGSVRLAVIRAHAMDRLGRTGEAMAALTDLLQTGEEDPVAINTYIDISIRCGFTAEAISFVEKLLGTAREKDRQTELLLVLFGLVQSSNPADPRLEAIAWRIGLLADQSDEIQEGRFIVLYLQATLSEAVRVTEERKHAIRDRMDLFALRFPESKLFRRAAISDELPLEDLQRQLSQILGDQTQLREFQQRHEDLLQRGKAPIPFIWRPRRILASVHDVVTLWELAKRSSADARQYHLCMIAGPWTPMPLADMKGKIPLLDIPTLLVIKDLGLFDVLFRLFEKIAVSQSTMRELQRLANPLDGSLHRDQCVALISELKNRLPQILQPSTFKAPIGESNEDRLMSDEMKELSRSGGYLLYSDDGFFRIFAGPSGSTGRGMCTLDLLHAAEEAKLLDSKACSKAISQLCAWNVSVLVTDRNIIDSLPQAILSARDVNQAVDAIKRHEQANVILERIWGADKEYGAVQSHASRFLTGVLSMPGNNVVAISAIAAIWYGKARLRTDVTLKPIARLAVMLVDCAAHLKEPTGIGIRNLWSLFEYLLEFEYIHDLDDVKRRDAIGKLAIATADKESHLSQAGQSIDLKERLLQVFPLDSIQREIFSEAHARRSSQLAPKQA